MEWFKIEWKGPYSLEKARSVKMAEGFGVYVICEAKDKTPKLLYIGKTYIQDFAKRLKQHQKSWMANIMTSKIKVYFGSVGLPEGKKISAERISDVEQILIHFLRPPFNTMSKRGYKGRSILIFNLGKAEALGTIISNDRELLAIMQKVANKS